MTQLNAVAVVATDSPERYAKQLAAHLGRKIDARETAEGYDLVFPVGRCALVSTPGTLTMTAHAEDEEGLERVTGVVGGHLETFGRRNELVVSWSR